MHIAEVQDRRRAEPKMVAISLLVLAICMFFPINYFLWFFDSGFSVNSRWVVIEVTLCEDHPHQCDGEEAPLQVGDRIVEFAGFNYRDFETNRAINPFEEIEPGDEIDILFTRDGTEQWISWQIPIQDEITRLVSLIAPFFVFGPFWLAGSAILIFMRPRSRQWLLLVLMNFLTAFWLATGIYSNFRVLYSSLLLHAASWMMLPVYLHLHLIVPSSLVNRPIRAGLIVLYIFAGVMAVLELALIPPQYVYYISIFLLTLGSISLIIYRILRKDTTPADKIASQLMLLGISFAFLPGMIIWMIPTILNIEPPGVFATSVSMLALPLFPMFYTYTVFKRRLGIFEVRLNRLIGIYSVFIIYLLILSMALFFRASFPTPSSEVYAFYLLIIFAVGLAVFPLRDQFRRLINRFAYGTKVDPDDLYHLYASEIPASSDRESLVRLLNTSIIPPLRVNQSIILISEGMSFAPLFSTGLADNQLTLSPEEIAALKLIAGVYQPPRLEGESEDEDFPAWIRLALVLERRS